MWILLWPGVHSPLAAGQAANTEGRMNCPRSPEQS